MDDRCVFVTNGYEITIECSRADVTFKCADGHEWSIHIEDAKLDDPYVCNGIVLSHVKCHCGLNVNKAHVVDKYGKVYDLDMAAYNPDEEG